MTEKWIEPRYVGGKVWSWVNLLSNTTDMTDTATALTMLHALLPFLGTPVHYQLLVSASLC